MSSYNTHNYKHRTAAHVMEDIIARAWSHWFTYPTFTDLRGMPSEWKKPGALVEKLPEEDRRLLEELTAKDIDHRIDHARMYTGVPTQLGFRSRYRRVLEEKYEADRKAIEKR